MSVPKGELKKLTLEAKRRLRVNIEEEILAYVRYVLKGLNSLKDGEAETGELFSGQIGKKKPLPIPLKYQDAFMSDTEGVVEAILLVIEEEGLIPNTVLKTREIAFHESVDKVVNENKQLNARIEELTSENEKQTERLKKMMDEIDSMSYPVPVESPYLEEENERLARKVRKLKKALKSLTEVL